MNSDRTWRHWGRVDPYFGVLSHPRFQKTSIADSRAEFFDSGTGQIVSTLELLDKHFDRAQRSRALDFGCGVGRLTLPLARAYEHVVGVDISPHMLAECKDNAAGAGLDHIELASSSNDLEEVKGHFDLVHSYLVLQHIPVAKGMAIVNELLDRVAPGGLVSLHVSLAQEGSRLRSTLYALRRSVPGINVAVELMRHGRWNGPMMKMHDYPLQKLLEAFSRKSFGEVVVTFERQGSCLTCYLMSQRSSD